MLRTPYKSFIVMRLSGSAITTVVIALASLIGVLIFENEDSLLYAVSLALFTSSIFYTFTVIVPEIRQRHRVRKRLQQQYRSFKRRCIDLFLIASQSQDYQNRENLLEHQEFRRYFSICNSNGQSRWD